METEEKVILGYYKDGKPISEHPSEREIAEHLDEYVELWKSNASREQMEVINEMRNAILNQHFRELSRGKTPEQAVDMAITWWAEQYPWEVQPFLRYIRSMRETLANAKGFSTDKDKSMLLEGSMPLRIRIFLLAYNPRFFSKTENKFNGLTLFYKRFQAGKIGGA